MTNSRKLGQLLHYLLGASAVFLTFLDLALQIFKHLVEFRLFKRIHGRDRVDSFNTILAKSDRRREEASGSGARFNVCALGDTLLTVLGAHDLDGEVSASVGHRESSGPTTGLGLHNFITTEHDALGESFDGSLGEVGASDVREEGEDSGTSMASNDRDVDFANVHALVSGDESVGTDNVESGDTKQFVFVISAQFF
jgi:hypothetical protein